MVDPDALAAAVKAIANPREAPAHARRRSSRHHWDPDKAREAFVANPAQPKTHYSVSSLKHRGWTDAMVRDLLGDPDKRSVNPHYRKAAQTRLYAIERVHETEATEAFAERLAKAEKTASGTRQVTAPPGGDTAAIRNARNHSRHEPSAARAVAGMALRSASALRFRPSPRRMPQLAHTIVADDTINIDPTRCSGCQQMIERKKREHDKALSWGPKDAARTDDIPCGNRRASSSAMAARQVRQEMYPHVLQAVRQNALRLLQLGFVQSSRKPWLLMFRLPERHGVVFANFGSTEEVPIWTDHSALIHWKLHNCSDAEEETLVRLLLRRCRAAGAEVRVSFYDLGIE